MPDHLCMFFCKYFSAFPRFFLNNIMTIDDYFELFFVPVAPISEIKIELSAYTF